MDIDKIQTVLSDTKLQKDITTSNTMGLPGNTGLSRQDLEAVLRVISDRNTPVRDRMKREKGMGLAHAWNIRTSINAVQPINTVFAENALGQTLTPTYIQKTAAYKALGLVGVVSNFALEAGRSFTDLEAEEVEATLRAVIQAEEWLILHGDSTVTNANSVNTWDGLDKQVQTNVISNAGSFSTDMLDHAFQMIRANGGGANPGQIAVVCSYGIQRQINQTQQTAGNLRMMFTADQLDQVALGLRTSIYQSPIGPVPIIGSYFANPQGFNPYPWNAAGSSGSSGNTTSNIYIIDFSTMSMVDLLPLCKEPLAMYNADNTRFLIKEYSTFAVKVEQFNALIKGVTEPTY